MGLEKRLSQKAPCRTFLIDGAVFNQTDAIFSWKHWTSGSLCLESCRMGELSVHAYNLHRGPLSRGCFWMLQCQENQPLHAGTRTALSVVCLSQELSIGESRDPIGWLVRNRWRLAFR